MTSCVDKAEAGPYLRMAPAGPAAAGATLRGFWRVSPLRECASDGGSPARWGFPADRSTRSDLTGFWQMLSIGAIAAKVFGTSNDRRLKSYRPTVEAINALEPELERLTDAELRARTDAFRKRLADGESLDDLLVPAFATVREAAKRTLGQRHFDVQLIGGMVLHQGRIAEMKTGEGKTLVATLPVYLNALAGKRRARRHRQRLPRPARRRVDGPHLQVPRPHRRRASCTSSTTTSGARSTPATSPTAPTTSSASTTCATT